MEMFGWNFGGNRVKSKHGKEMPEGMVLPFTPLGEISGLGLLSFLIDRGMEPHHYLLDVGCGPLRTGKYAILYLNSGHYYGIDAHRPSLKKGIKLFLKPNGLTIKKPNITAMDGRTFRLKQRFDFAVANSVFTHLNDRDIELVLINIGNHLVNGGKFYASFLSGSKSRIKRMATHHLSKFPYIFTYRNKNPYHQPLSFYKKITPKNLELNLSGWKNVYPHRQMVMLEFRRKKD